MHLMLSQILQMNYKGIQPPQHTLFPLNTIQSSPSLSSLTQVLFNSTPMQAYKVYASSQSPLPIQSIVLLLLKVS
jgi:hypothetical protein